jgi:hypothetical protein
MRSFLAETAQELIRRPMDVLRCFWPAVIFFIGWMTLLVLLLAGQSEIDNNLKPDSGAVAVFCGALIALFAVTIAPGVIRWHRRLIANHPTDWLPFVPFRSAILYTLCVVFAFVLFVAISKIFSSLFHDLLLPVIGLLTGGVELPWILDPSKNPVFSVWRSHHEFRRGIHTWPSVYALAGDRG